MEWNPCPRKHTFWLNLAPGCLALPAGLNLDAANLAAGPGALRGRAPAWELSPWLWPTFLPDAGLGLPAGKAWPCGPAVSANFPYSTEWHNGLFWPVCCPFPHLPVKGLPLTGAHFLWLGRTDLSHPFQGGAHVIHHLLHSDWFRERNMTHIGPSKSSPWLLTEPSKKQTTSLRKKPHTLILGLLAVSQCFSKCGLQIPGGPQELCRGDREVKTTFIPILRFHVPLSLCWPLHW